MKILWLYRYAPQYNFDHYLHMDIAEKMAKLEGIELKCYGHKLHESNPDLCLTQYKAYHTMESLYEMFKFDLIIICTKSRMFLNYLPKNAMQNTGPEIREGCWLPRDFAEFDKAPKIVLEEDFHYEDSNSWYEENGIKIIFQRHFVNTKLGDSYGSTKLKHLFLPFSIDTNIFKDFGNQRVKKIAFTGSSNILYYKDRVTACEMLRSQGYLEHSSPKRRDDFAYIEDLNRFFCHLSGESFYHILPSKLFEITACGSLLFTNASSATGMELVFPENTYIKWKEDFSDILDKAKMIINEPEMVKEISERGKKYTLENHTHEIRTRQLLKILEKEL